MYYITFIFMVIVGLRFITGSKIKIPSWSYRVTRNRPDWFYIIIRLWIFHLLFIIILFFSPILFYLFKYLVSLCHI